MKRRSALAKMIADLLDTFMAIILCQPPLKVVEVSGTHKPSQSSEGGDLHEVQEDVPASGSHSCV